MAIFLTAHVRYGSKAAVMSTRNLRLLSYAKRTLVAERPLSGGKRS